MNGAVIIRGEAMEQHDVRAAPWAQPAGRQPIGAAAQLLMDLLALGTVARLDLLDGALELARREGAAQALQDAADDVDSREGTDAAGIVRWLELRADRARAGQL